MKYLKRYESVSVIDTINQLITIYLMKSYKNFLNEDYYQRRLDKLNLNNKLVSIGPMNKNIPECKIVIGVDTKRKGIKIGKAFIEFKKLAVVVEF